MSDAKKFGEFVCIIKIKLAKGNLKFSPVGIEDCKTSQWKLNSQNT